MILSSLTQPLCVGASQGERRRHGGGGAAPTHPHPPPGESFPSACSDRRSEHMLESTREGRGEEHGRGEEKSWRQHSHLTRTRCAPPAVTATASGGATRASVERGRGPRTGLASMCKRLQALTVVPPPTPRSSWGAADSTGPLRGLGSRARPLPRQRQRRRR